ncbi:MAG: HlyD family efflux transporter periplasmic adaptor subunit [Firmicutes bacterium]|nr:HlyD family efflux transporter periplasmic adaptor subunit [Bacillota bacterium]
MSKEDRVRKRKRRKKFRIILVSTILLYFLFRLMPTLYASGEKTFTVKRDTLKVSHKTQGIILKNEKIYNSRNKGKINYFVSEGTKVSAGTKVVEVLNNNANELKKQLKQIDEKISKYKDANINKKLFNEDIKKTNEKINNIVNEIKDNIENNNYEKIVKLKQDLKNIIEKKNLVSGDSTYLKVELNRLLENRKELNKKITSINKGYYTKQSGIVSYNFDGLENIFNIENMLNITPNRFKILQMEKNKVRNSDNIEVGQPLFKVCDNFKWFIVTKLRSDSINFLKEGNNVDIHFLDEDSYINAKVVKISQNNNEKVLIFEFDTYFYDFYDKRYVDIEIIEKNKQGLKIPKTSIVLRDGIKGVYVNNMDNIIRFRPIKIISENREYAIVDENYIELEIDNEKKKLKSIVMYDEIVLHGDKVKESKVIN